MKWLPNETGHLIRIYIREGKKPAKNQRIVHLCLSISSWFQAPLRLKKEQSYFKQLLFKQLNSFPDQSWILKLLKHQLPSENEGRSSQEIKWFPTRPFLLAVCLPTGNTTQEPGAIHFQSVMGSFHGLHSEQPRAAEGAWAWPFLLIGKRWSSSSGFLQQFSNTLQQLITYGRLTYRSNRSAFQTTCLQPSKMSHQLPLSSLVLLCFCCCSSVCHCRRAEVFSWDTFLWLLGLLCSVVTKNSLPLLVSLSPPVREDVLGDAGPLLWE